MSIDQYFLKVKHIFWLTNSWNKKRTKNKNRSFWPCFVPCSWNMLYSSTGLNESSQKGWVETEHLILFTCFY